MSGMQSAERLLELCLLVPASPGARPSHTSSFVHAQPDPRAHRSSTEIQNRCVAILAKLFHAPSVQGGPGRGDPVGTATVGSSEAIMLGGALRGGWLADVLGRMSGGPTAACDAAAHSAGR